MVLQIGVFVQFCSVQFIAVAIVILVVAADFALRCGVALRRCLCVEHYGILFWFAFLTEREMIVNESRASIASSLCYRQ